MQHYVDLGYQLITVDWSRFRQFYVAVADLMTSSRARVIAKCECCELEREVSYYQYSKICHQCNDATPASEETRKRQSEAHRRCNGRST